MEKRGDAAGSTGVWGAVEAVLGRESGCGGVVEGVEFSGGVFLAGLRVFRGVLRGLGLVAHVKCPIGKVKTEVVIR